MAAGRLAAFPIMKRGPKERPCDSCGTPYRQYDSKVRHCSSRCFYDDAREKRMLEERSGQEKPKRTSMRRKSKTRQAEEIIYKERRVHFLSMPENNICFIDGCNRQATTIEHIMGRQGFADDWARDNKITLYIDERYWRGCCWQHNGELENNPELSKKYQLSKIHGGKKD